MYDWLLAYDIHTDLSLIYGEGKHEQFAEFHSLCLRVC